MPRNPVCECEAVECGHPEGPCNRKPMLRATVCGQTQNLCAVCAGVAQAFAGDEYVVKGEPR